MSEEKKNIANEEVNEEVRKLTLEELEQVFGGAAGDGPGKYCDCHGTRVAGCGQHAAGACFCGY